MHLVSVFEEGRASVFEENIVRVNSLSHGANKGMSASRKRAMLIPLFLYNDDLDAINDKLHRQRGQDNAQQARNHRPAGNAHGLRNLFSN